MFSKIYQINSDGSTQIEVFTGPGQGECIEEKSKEVVRGNLKTVYDNKDNVLYTKTYMNMGKIPSFSFAKPHIPNYAEYSNSKMLSYYYTYTDRKAFTKHFKFNAPEFICPKGEIVHISGFGINMLEGKIIAVKEYIITKPKAQE